ncbi:MAG: hypothetical protein JSV09_05255 [Thermoplasmata archaeon]|nr:MAG: hypothetical protein JSV09_05255 [Thermoplasmata archaeon]
MIIEDDNRIYTVKVSIPSLFKMISMINNIEETMLRIAAKRGNIGASRDDLFKELKAGIAYEELERHIQELEQKGYITIDWLGTYDFVVTITPQGLELLT